MIVVELKKEDEYKIILIKSQPMGIVQIKLTKQ